jgi:anti-sigma-K factor RskA
LTSPGKTLRLPVAEKTLTDISELAISVEDKGATTQRREPSLPYLFKGALVQKAL